MLLFCAGIGLLRIPTLSKAPLDLFKAYIAVQNLGGFINVSESHTHIMKRLCYNYVA